MLEPALDDEADARLDAAALRAELSARLARLPDGTREAVLLRVVEQLDYEELGRRLGCSNAAARLRVSRGLRELRREPAPNFSPPKEPCHERRVRRRRRPRGAAARDRPRRARAGRGAGGSRRWRCSRCCCAGSTAVAAATGVIWSEPKVDNSVPAVPEWQYYSEQPVRRTAAARC